eukprot:268573-Amphidinium_carterae.4
MSQYMLRWTAKLKKFRKSPKIAHSAKFATRFVVGYLGIPPVPEWRILTGTCMAWQVQGIASTVPKILATIQAGSLRA